MNQPSTVKSRLGNRKHPEDIQVRAQQDWAQMLLENEAHELFFCVGAFG